MTDKTVLEAIQARLRAWPQEDISRHALKMLQEMERAPASVVSEHALALATVLCLRDEDALLWSINGTPRVVELTASEQLATRDYAG
jgi:hypothetical protein